MQIFKYLSPALEKELIKKWYLPRAHLNVFGRHAKGFVSIPQNQSKENLSLLIDPSITPPIRMLSTSEFSNSYIHSCLVNAKDYRRKQKDKLDTGASSAYRLVHETGDGLPGLAIDIYANYAQIHMYSLFWKPFIKFIAEKLMEELGIKGVYLKHRIRGRPQVSRHYAGEKAPENKVVVKENGFSFLVHLTDPHSSGLFLDMRSNRKAFYDIAKKEFGNSKITVLNTFCHTCSFSVYAASLAASTTNIDLAEEYLDWAKSNFKLNHLSLDSHQFISEDVLSALPSTSNPSNLQLPDSKSKKHSIPSSPSSPSSSPSSPSSPSASPSASPSSSLPLYHCVILDPPSFLHTTSPLDQRTGTGDAYAGLAQRAGKLVRAGGFLFAFSNTRDVARDAWVKSIEERLGVEKREQKDGKEEMMSSGGGEWRKVMELGQDVDFRYKEGDLYGNYLKGLVLQKIDVKRKSKKMKS